MRPLLLDSSVVLAAVENEPGGAEALAAAANAQISAVNAAEVLTKLMDRGYGESDARAIWSVLDLSVIEFDADLAIETGLLRQSTRRAGLSLGDRACLATALRLGADVLTADRAWANVSVGVNVSLIR